MLLARRLLEAGVGLAAVYWHYEGPDDSPVWDTHQNNFVHLRKRLMPPTDQGFAALLEDLGRRGLLDDTVVICMGEFGRAPRVALEPKFAGATPGRKHWASVYSIALAGAGVQRGAIVGASCFAPRNSRLDWPVNMIISPFDRMRKPSPAMSPEGPWPSTGS